MDMGSTYKGGEDMKHKLSYDDLANIYSTVTGGKARIRPMDSVVKWALSRKDLFTTDKKGYLYKKVKS